MATVYEKMTAIANNIRSKTGKTELLTLDGMASSVNEVYNKGYSEAETKYTSKPYIDTSKITNFSRFCVENRFTADDLAKIDTSNGTNFSYMFQGCNKLTTIPQLDTSKCITCSYMFHSCSLLTTIPQLDTSKCTIFYSMFSGCTKLTTIPQLDTSSGTGFNSMFANCSSLIEIPELDTSNGTIFSGMFNKCTKLTTILKLNLSNANNVSTMFTNCLALENITFEGTIPLSIMFQYSNNLTHDSLMSIINALADKSSSTGTYKLNIGSTNIAKLTAEELQIIENKGWTYA